MPPPVALILWLILLVALLWFDPAKVKTTSPALWVPVTWMFIIGSRLPAQWLGGQVGMLSEALEEGNPLDRAFFTVLILLAVGILASRSFNWTNFFSRNLALVAFIILALVSVFWSDFPFVTFKRWFRDLGNYLVILIALSDARPLDAVRTLLRRLCYLLIPLSILLIKYYPGIGVQYNFWTGTVMNVGPTTSKNGLGLVCLVSGLFFFWDTVTRWSDRKAPRTRRIILVNLAFLAMTLHLLHITDSATSRVCLAMGCFVIAVAHTKASQRHPDVIKIGIPVCLCLYSILAFGFGLDLNAMLAQAVGRNPSLTGRTDIWKFLLSMGTNPLVGTGYESFWLGSRLQPIWQRFGALNEAHNGYLEIYLNLGLIGLFLLCGFLIASYRTICKRLTPFSPLASLSLALWTVALFYNVTESTVKGHLMWVTFLLVVVSLPSRDRSLRSYSQAPLAEQHGLLQREPDLAVGRPLNSGMQSPSSASVSSGMTLTGRIGRSSHLN